MATLYDKSLDQIAEHSWDFSSSYTNNLPAYIEWNSFNFPILDFYEVANYKSLTESSLSLARFDARFVNGLSFNQLFIRGTRFAAETKEFAKMEPMKLNETRQG